jgi:hypothetical protein
MPQVGFEPTIPVFERAKTIHAIDRPATVIGGVPQIPHANAAMVLEVRPQSYPCTSVRVHYLLLFIHSTVYSVRY